MSIVKMKRVQLLAMEDDRPAILEGLQKLGCVQIEDQSPMLAQEDWAQCLRKTSAEAEPVRRRLESVKTAMDTLSKLPGKRGFFLNKREEIKLSALTDPQFIDSAVKTADEINELSKSIASLTAEEGKLQNHLATLSVWAKLDVPLDTASSGVMEICFGAIGARADIGELKNTLEQQAPLSEIFLAGSDSEQQYLLLVCHKSNIDEALTVLKTFGFGRMLFKDVKGSARENIQKAELRIKNIHHERESLKERVSAFVPKRHTLELAVDSLTAALEKENVCEKLLHTESVFYMEGWVPADSQPSLDSFLAKYDSSVNYRDPTDDEDTPVLLKNSKYTRPFNMVTKMYSLPNYKNIDPNPLIAPFYAIFFGMMYGDLAYGLIMLTLGLLITYKYKPKGGVGYAFSLMIPCGITTMIFGILYGGFFSDALKVIGETFFNSPDWSILGSNKPILNTMEDPMSVLGVALALGVVQLITGMCVRGYILIRDGRPLEAFMRIIPWWFFFAATAVTYFTNSFTWIIAAIVGLILTQGYNKKGILRKLLGGIISVYDITAYLSDILSYSRLMALGLAGGVIGSVFNQLGAMPAQIPVVGFIIFIIVFIIGHIFNMGINLVGTYVHAARLQYIEYFGKFYEPGGVEFCPFSVNTKYVDIIVEKE